ncbi:MAG: HlyD family secretion protein [Chitinophagales bacterium]
MQDSMICYLPRLGKGNHIIYFLVLLMTSSAMISLPFIYTTVSVKCYGIIRPVNERTELKAMVGGIIDSIYCKEGDPVKKDAIVLRLKDPGSEAKSAWIESRAKLSSLYIHDLELLANGTLHRENFRQLLSPLYREEAARFLNQEKTREALLRKANKDLEMNAELAKDKIISPKEFFDLQIEQEKISADARAFRRSQLAEWEQALAKYRLESLQCEQDRNQLATFVSNNELRSPVSGIIQGINGRYAGAAMQANETICSISPENGLIAEFFASATDIGMLKLQQEARFQIDAFNYNYFGSISGKIISIANDFTIVNDQPMFRIRCSLDKQELFLKNGFKGILKKGLSLQARFIIARRSLWNLLFDKMDDWLNPLAAEHHG